MPYKDFYFGAFTPDLGGAPNPADPAYLVDCLNLRPTPAGYRGTRVFTDVASAALLTGGAASIVDIGTTYAAVRNDTTYLFVASENVLNQSNTHGTSWSNVDTITDENLDIAQFDDYVITCEYNVAPMYKDITTSQATVFSTLPDSPPQGGTVARIRDHLVIGRTSSDQYSVQWSAIGDPTDWPTPLTAEAASKESGSQTLPSELGIVTKVVGGEEFGLVFQEHGITRMTYVGGRVVYEFDTFERNVGKLAIQSPYPIPQITKVNDLYYFGEPNIGFFVTDGYRVRKISDGSISESFYANTISHPDAGAGGHPLSMCFDWARQQLIWTNSATFALGYNPALNQFFSMDGTFGRLFPIPFVLASGTAPVEVQQISTTGYLQKLTAANAGIGLQTGFIEIEPGYYVQLHGAHLLGAGVPGSLTLAYKAADDYNSDISIVQTGFTSLTAPGRGIVSSGRANAPLFAFRVSGTGGESQLIQGIRVYYERGERVQ